MGYISLGFVTCFDLFETVSPYKELTGLELCLYQIGLEFTEILLPLLPECWIITCMFAFYKVSKNSKMTLNVTIKYLQVLFFFFFSNLSS